jgi:formylglycine-generating enzyme required for sulfatase activity
LAFKLTSSIPVQEEESVTTIGFPRISQVPWAVTKGDIVGRKGKTIAFSGAVDDGNSGGPLIKDGEVIGVVTEVTEKFAYAIPTVIAQYVLKGWGVKTTTPLFPVAGQEWHDPVSGIDFVWVPEGCFQMGQTEAGEHYLIQVVGEKHYYMGYTHELPRHNVCLDGFWMGKYEITQTQWQQVMGENPSYFNKNRVGQDTSSHPVEQVSWNDVQKFLRKLNEHVGEEMYRLPTEAEWEYGARAGTETIFYFGNKVGKLGEYAWYWDNTNRTHPVGQRKPNVWGLYNMHGNVSEWCADPWHDNYDGAPTDGSVWETSGNTSFRVVRGGSWTTTPWLSRIAIRFKGGLDSRNNGAGFRVVVGSGAWTQ